MAPLDSSMGVLLIGVIIAAVLCGFTCVQTWYYYTHYPADRGYIKVLVAVVFISDTLHQAMISHVVYTYLVTYFGVTSELTNLVWSMPGEVFPNAITTFLVQCFLAMRVYMLSNKNWFATGSVLMIVIANFIATIAYGIQAVQYTTYADEIALKGLSMSVNALTAAADLLIAILLCWMLQTSRTGFRKSNTMINRLMIFSVNTGLLTSICALASLVSIYIWPTTFIYIAFYFCTGRLYCNALLATLNTRRELRGDTINEDLSLSFRSRAAQRKGSECTTLGTSQKCLPNSISIKIDTTQECIGDEQYPTLTGNVKVPEAV